MKIKNFLRKLKNRKENLSASTRVPAFGGVKNLPDKPLSKNSLMSEGEDFIIPLASQYDHSFRIKLYRFLTDNIPALNSYWLARGIIKSSPSDISEFFERGLSGRFLTPPKAGTLVEAERFSFLFFSFLRKFLIFISKFCQVFFFPILKVVFLNFLEDI